MRIKCLHGYFIFEESQAGDVSRFMSLYGLSLVPKDNYYTFPLLELAPSYSFVGEDYLGVPATKLYEGLPWEVFKANKLVYDFRAGKVKPIASVATVLDLVQAANYSVSSGLILPGSITDDGSRVTDYSAWLLWDSFRFKYTEVIYATI